MGATNQQNFNWFDDAHWNATEQNIRNYAKTAQTGKLKGILFDGEYYAGETWNYPVQRDRWRNNKTFDEYQAQVRKRGAALMRAVQAECPGCTLFTTSLLSNLKDAFADHPDPATLRQRLEPDGYGLWAAFVNGLLDAVPDGVQIIDGDEPAYYYYRASFYDGTTDLLKKDALAVVDQANQAKYAAQVKIGHAVYVDLVLDLFNPQSPDCAAWCGVRMPHFLSAADRLKLLEHNLYHALRTSEGYVWVYAEETNWWKDQTFWWGQNVPPGAEDAIRRARTKIDAGQPLGFDIDPAVDEALKKCQAATGKDCG
jgi:hypothetical protein